MNEPCSECKRTDYGISVRFANDEVLCWPCVSKEMPSKDDEPPVRDLKEKKGKKK